MSHKTQIVNNLHKDFRKDPYIIELLGAAGLKLDELSEASNNLSKEFWFDTMSILGITFMERQLDYKTKTNSLDKKRKEIEMRWNSAGKCDLDLIKTIARAWKDGDIDVKFINSEIVIIYTTSAGVIDEGSTFRNAIESVKPAHLPFAVKFFQKDHSSLNTYGVVHTYGRTINREVK